MLHPMSTYQTSLKMSLRKAIDLQSVKDFILNQSPETKIYIGSDSERFKMNGDWYADYMTVVVVHIDGCHGCKVFGQISRDRDYDQKKNRPQMRMMNEVYRTAEMYLSLQDVLIDREVEIHLDISKETENGSNVAMKEAIGYIRGTCNIIALLKPDAPCASFGADRLKDYMSAAVMITGSDNGWTRTCLLYT